MRDEISFTMVRYMNSINRMVPVLKTGFKQYERNIVYSIQIANIGTIFLIVFIYLTIVNEISSRIRYADYVIQLLCKLSTT
jgi:hypothetical protein